jgi:flap endonuclease-1
MFTNKLEFSKPDEEELRKFLVEEKGFAADRVDGILKRLKVCFESKPQMSLETFFGKPQKITKDAPKDLKKKSAMGNSSNKKSKK